MNSAQANRKCTIFSALFTLKKMVFLVVKELRTHCHLAPTRTIDMTKSRVAVIIYCLVRFQCLFFPLWCLAGWKLTQCEKDSSRSLLDSSDICNRRTGHVTDRCKLWKLKKKSHCKEYNVHKVKAKRSQFFARVSKHWESSYLRKI